MERKSEKLLIMRNTAIEAIKKKYVEIMVT